MPELIDLRDPLMQFFTDVNSTRKNEFAINVERHYEKNTLTRSDGESYSSSKMNITTTFEYGYSPSTILHFGVQLSPQWDQKSIQLSAQYDAIMFEHSKIGFGLMLGSSGAQSPMLGVQAIYANEVFRSEKVTYTPFAAMQLRYYGRTFNIKGSSLGREEVVLAVSSLSPLLGLDLEFKISDHGDGATVEGWRGFLRAYVGYENKLNLSVKSKSFINNNFIESDSLFVVISLGARF